MISEYHALYGILLFSTIGIVYFLLVAIIKKFANKDDLMLQGRPKEPEKHNNDQND